MKYTVALALEVDTMVIMTTAVSPEEAALKAMNQATSLDIKRHLQECNGLRSVEEITLQHYAFDGYFVAGVFAGHHVSLYSSNDSLE